MRQGAGHRGLTPLHITLVDDSDLATEGLRALLAPYTERVVVLSDREAIARPEVLDAVLYEPMHHSSGGRVAAPHAARRRHRPRGRVQLGGRRGAPAPTTAPHLSKSLSASQLVVAVEELVEGRLVPAVALVPDPEVPRCARAPTATPPRSPQLTQRELDVVTMVTRGCSNREIAGHLGLSLNSVKTYIRTAYRKIGAERRTQAVLWGIEHGLGADPEGDTALVC